MKKCIFEKYDEEIKPKINQDFVVRSLKPVTVKVPNKHEYTRYEDVYHNINTGKTSDKLYHVIRERKYRVINNQYGDDDEYLVTYWQATKDKKYLCCIVLSLNFTEARDNSITNFKEVDRYYFSKDRKIIISNSYDIGEEIFDGKYRIINGDEIYDLEYDFSILTSVNAEEDEYDIFANDDSEYFRSEAEKVFPKIVNLNNHGICVPVCDSVYFCAYIEENKEKARKLTKKQKNVNKFIEKTPEISYENIFGEKMTNCHVRTDYCVIEKIEDGLLVIRTFAAIFKASSVGFYNRVSFSLDEFDMLEYERIYIDGNKIYSYYINSDFEWICESLRIHDGKTFFPKDTKDLIRLDSRKGKQDQDFVLIKYNEDDFDGTILEYAKGIFEKFKNYKKYRVLKAYLRYPLLVESFCKYGLEYLLDCVTASFFGDPIVDLDNCIEFNRDKNAFNQILGLSWKQIEVVSKSYKKMMDIIEEERNPNIQSNKGQTSNYSSKSIHKDISLTKEVFGAKNVSDVDVKTFETVFNFINFDVYHMPLAALSCVIKVRELYGLKGLIGAIEIMRKYSGLSFRDYGEEYRVTGIAGIVSYYCDYIDLVDKTNNSHMFKYSFKNPADLLDKHNILVSIYNAQKDEFQNQKFEKAKKRVENFVFEDTNYKVVIPTGPSDMANEGMALSHCVKTYIDRVIDGKTNIMFIRKTIEPEKPFFTVEISDNGKIEQIHGFSNRNINTEPDMLYFIDDWIKAKGLILNDCDKIR